MGRHASSSHPQAYIITDYRRKRSWPEETSDDSEGEKGLPSFPFSSIIVTIGVGSLYLKDISNEMYFTFTVCICNSPLNVQMKHQKLFIIYLQITIIITIKEKIIIILIITG